MRDTKRQRIANFYIFAERIGVDADTADKLRRIEMTLHRWAEAECNGEIQREGVCHACGWPKEAHKPARMKPRGTRIKGFVRRAA